MSSEDLPLGSRPPLAVCARRVEGAPVVAVRVWVLGGSRAETAPGVALVAGRLLAEGTQRRGWARIAEDAEDRGLSIGATAGYEVQSLAIDGLAADWRRALEWAAELTLESVFSPERCRWVAEQATAELESLADHPDVVADWAFRRQLYEPHPRARPLQGTVEALAALEAESCREFHRRALSRGVIVSVAGAIDPAAVRRAAHDLFAPALGDPRTAAPAAPKVSATPCEGLESRQTVPLAAGEQAHLLLGGLTVRRDDPMLVPLELVAVILGAGGGLVGRIPHRVREVEGLAYACRIATTAGAGIEPGRLEVYLATAPDQAAGAERAVREELARLGDGSPASRELEDARSFLLGAEPFRRETARQWAALMGEATLYGIPVDRPDWVRGRIAAVTATEVGDAARRFLSLERLKVTLATPR